MEDVLKARTWDYDYDDSAIDDIIWSEISGSEAMADFVCYLVHKLADAKHTAEATARAAGSQSGDDAVPAGYLRAIGRLHALASSGNATAMFHMGKIHAFGIAIERDMPLAIEWYEKAVALGDVRAASNLGWLYQSGTGVPEDKTRAFELLSVGAANGMVVAAATVGMMRITGEGCARDVEAGLRMLESAFDAGYLNAGNHLSDLYFADEYVPRDIDLGHAWLLKVAERGDVRSMAILGHRLVSGSHGKQAYETGIKLLAVAIDKGFTLAYLWLGGLYRDGHGVERDLEKAANLYQAGAEAGDMQCAFALATLEHDAAGAPPTSLQ